MSIISEFIVHILQRPRLSKDINMSNWKLLRTLENLYYSRYLATSYMYHTMGIFQRWLVPTKGEDCD